MSEVPGSEAEFNADLVTLAIGFVHPTHAGMIEARKAETGLELAPCGNVKAHGTMPVLIAEATRKALCNELGVSRLVEVMERLPRHFAGGGRGSQKGPRCMPMETGVRFD